MKTIRIQDATYEILVRLSRKLKLTVEATADKLIGENQKWRNKQNQMQHPLIRWQTTQQMQTNSGKEWPRDCRKSIGDDTVIGRRHQEKFLPEWRQEANYLKSSAVRHTRTERDILMMSIWGTYTTLPVLLNMRSGFGFSIMSMAAEYKRFHIHTLQKWVHPFKIGGSLP